MCGISEECCWLLDGWDLSVKEKVSDLSSSAKKSISLTGDMMSPEELEARRKANDLNAGGSEDNSLIIKK
jgi:hypothetical protein